MPESCCCRWGAARSGDYPEFVCARCPRHGDDVETTALCRRHTAEQKKGK